MILILTPYSFNPLHPRVEYIEKYLLKNGYKVEKYNLNCTNRVIVKLNWFSLTFFQIPAFFKSIKYLWKYRNNIDIVYIQDLQYIHISILAKLFRKKVIYDTLDNNVELNFYHLSNRFKFFKQLSFIKNIISFIEKTISKYFCDEIIVNSKALVEYFRPIDVNLIYYTSPFENKFKISFEKPIAFLYLGAFSKDKGANEILNFLDNQKSKAFIFGDTTDDILDKINRNSDIFYEKRISSTKLAKLLNDIFANYRIIGFSLIKDVHYSYATQEANKDIDYLAMGIPIIANHRKPTKEKIEAGCGVFIDDDIGIKKLLNDEHFYQKISDNCIQYYSKNYAQEIFEKKLLEVVKNV
jgi:glycosyltransferase involved in cell wall biosynthesis